MAFPLQAPAHIEPNIFTFPVFQNMERINLSFSGDRIRHIVNQFLRTEMDRTYRQFEVVSSTITAMNGGIEITQQLNPARVDFLRQVQEENRNILQGLLHAKTAELNDLIGRVARLSDQTLKTNHLETFLQRLIAQSDRPIEPGSEGRILSYLTDFFSYPEATEAIFFKFFGGRGENKALEMLREYYELPYFHRMISRDTSLRLLLEHSSRMQTRGQCLIRFSATNFQLGALALDALRTDENSTYTCSVRFCREKGGWIMGDGNDAQGRPKLYARLRHIQEANTNTLPHPIPS